MAQEKTARKGNKTFKKVIGNIWDWILDAAYWTWDNILQYILMVLIFGIIGILLFVVFYSWPVFILWCIFAPRTAASWLYEDELMPTLSELMQELNGWIVSCLPFFWKKYFMEAHGIKHYSVRLQLKYYFRYKRTQETVDQMSPEACEALWRNPRLGEDMIFLSNRKDAKQIFSELEVKDQVKAYKVAKQKDITIMWLMSYEAIEELCSNLGGDMSMTHVYSDIVTAGKKVSDDLFATIAKQCPSLVAEYVSRNTPSDGMIQYLISNEETFSKELSYCIRKYGLSPKLLVTISEGNSYSNYSEDILINVCRKFLSANGDEKMGSLVGWYLNTLPYIPAEAQKCMSAWQLRLFLKCGKALDPRAVTHFLVKGDAEIAEIVLGIPNLVLNREQSNLVIASQTLTEIASAHNVRLSQ